MQIASSYFKFDCKYVLIYNFGCYPKLAPDWMLDFGHRGRKISSVGWVGWGWGYLGYGKSCGKIENMNTFW